jgi:alkanesulfonate monooxygenase SsuD/methylene tetrahydromethanopterin reductase-like flavin-dependent oxidoreductase (luciferase family)
MSGTSRFGFADRDVGFSNLVTAGRLTIRKAPRPDRAVRTLPYHRTVSNGNGPFARGSISIRLYPHNELAAGAIVDELCEQARLALRCGFDGVMTSEHHGGFSGYTAQPLQMATFVLEESSIGWAAAAPLLLPLRATALVAEEVAWLNARHPGRVGLGVAAGALPLDFDIAQVDRGEGLEAFKVELPRLVAMLRGEDLGDLAGDPALGACRADPIPVLSAAVSSTAARRAAQCGAGILMEGMSSTGRLKRLTEAFDLAGGTGSKVLIRRVWLGDIRTDLVRRQRAVYDTYSGDTTTFGDDQTIASTDPEEMVARLCDLLEATDTDALNVRVHLPGMAPEAIREQIEALGVGVVGRLKGRWPAR